MMTNTMLKRKLNVLVACESSGVVRDAFRKLGHNAWSCDLLPCDPASKYRRYHVQGDVVALLENPYKGGARLAKSLRGGLWDLLIAHPPCTYLCNSGVRWLFRDPDKEYVLFRHSYSKLTKGALSYRPANSDRAAAMRAAAKFFNRMWNAWAFDGIPHIAVENPIMHYYARQHCGCGKPDQIIQPWMFGHLETKATCLWLNGLPKLEPTLIVRQAMMALPKAQRNRVHYMPPSLSRWKERSKTYQGIALAMAQQWSDYILR